VGGVSVLFARLAKRLAECQGHEIFVIDYPDGFLTQSVLDNADIQKIAFSDDRPVSVPEDAVIVLQSRPDWFMPATLQIHDTARLLFWTCYPFNFVPTVPGLRGLTAGRPVAGRAVLRTLLRGYRRRVVRFLQFLVRHQAVVFMDDPNLQNTEYYLDTSIPNAKFLPIFAEDASPESRAGKRDWGNGLRVCWVGRIADFKYQVLKHAGEQLNAAAPMLGIPVAFTIVGSGEHLEDLRKDAQAWSGISVRFIDEIAPSALPAFLDAECDVMLAMGTSALESASRGIPTVLLDIFFAPVPSGYQFGWLHDRTGYSVGDVAPRERLHGGKDSLLTLLRDAVRGYPELSAKAQSYYKANHSPQAVIERFLNFAATSTCYYKEFRSGGFGRPDWLYEAFAALRRRVLRS
jgi:hypothetical protein